MLMSNVDESLRIGEGRRGKSIEMLAQIRGHFRIAAGKLALFDQLQKLGVALGVVTRPHGSGDLGESLAKERELATLYGLPVPDSVEDPQCLNTLGVWIFAVVAAAMVVFLGYNIRVWGLPLVMVAILIAAYTIGTVLIWYFFGADDLNKYVITKLGGEPRQLIDGRPNVLDILINSSQGLLGRFMDILLKGLKR